MWSAQPNDLMGGYIVTNYPHPLSEHDTRNNGDPRKRGYIFAECYTREDAYLVAALLNKENVQRKNNNG